MNVSVVKFCTLSESEPKSIWHMMVNCWPAELISVWFARGQPTKAVGMAEAAVVVDEDEDLDPDVGVPVAVAIPDS